MTHPAVFLFGPASACRAVTAALATISPVFLPVTWRLRGGPGRCEIREPGRTTVAATWGVAVQMHLAAPAPLKSIRVLAPTGGRFTL